MILAYGMETAFFRFFNKNDDKDKVISTSSISIILTSTLFLLVGFLFTQEIAALTQINAEYIHLVIWILFLDALVIIPFAYLRATEQPTKYAVIKILNVAINIGLNLFFLLGLKNLSRDSYIYQSLYVPNFEINYIFIANVIASGFTLLLMASFYSKLKLRFDQKLWKKMLAYAIPILIGGVAFSINEVFDRILLDRLLPEDIAETEVGMYSACYKLALFMTLFATAFRLGIEPYFFSHAKSENPQKNYAKILELFVAFGSVILLTVVVFADIIKPIIIRDSDYWEAMWIVPIVLIANFCLGIYHNLSVWYKITDKTRYGAYISVLGAFITLLANFLLIPIIGYKGSALATLAAYSTMMLASYFYGKKNYPIPYNLSRIGIYFILSALFSLTYFYGFRGNYAIGIPLLIVFLGLVIYFEKTQIQQLLGIEK